MSEIIGCPMRDLKGYLRPEQVRKIIAKARHMRDELLMRILWATGCRLHEMLLILFEDISWKERVIVMWTLKRKGSKKCECGERNPKRRIHCKKCGASLENAQEVQNMIQRIVSVDSRTVEMIRRYCLKRKIRKGPLFNLTDRRVEQIVLEAGKAAGISKVGGKPLHPHHLRHSHAVAWIRKNNTMEGLRKLQQRLGHASISTTAHYLQFATEESKPEVEGTFGEW